MEKPSNGAPAPPGSVCPTHSPCFSVYMNGLYSLDLEIWLLCPLQNPIRKGKLRQATKCTRAFSSCGEQGLLFVVGAGFSLRGFPCCRAWAPGRLGSVVVEHGLSCSVTCGVFPDQGSKPYPLHLQVDA